MEAIGPWKRISSLEIYNNPWIKVRHDEVIHPDGTEGIYGVVEFKNYAVGIVPFDSEGNILLVGQYRYALKEYSWEIPEGGSPLAEDPLQNGKRELEEETGWQAKDWKYLGEIAVSNSATNEKGCVYLARDLFPGIKNPESSEELKIKKVPLNEAYHMAMGGEITDSLSVLGIARAHYFLNDETYN